jgi:hypothetical protein
MRYRTGQQLTVPGKIFGVFASLGIETEGNWEIQLSTPASNQCVLVNDSTGEPEGMKILPETHGATRLVARNEEVYVKNCGIASTVVSILVFPV